MKLKLFTVFSLLSLLVGCKDNNCPSDNQVVSQRFIHKFGYPVSREEWEAKSLPGQVITTLHSGVTVTATYENGILHGPSTYTYPHSQTVKSYYLYSLGEPVKKVHYNTTGMPTREDVILSPTRYCTTLWYKEGTPLCVEEYSNGELVEGQYFTALNETESRVEKGNGLRMRRDTHGNLLSKDTVENGYLAKSETFFKNGNPESVISYKSGKLNGEKRTFNENGEPLAIEEWVGGLLHGKSTFFVNGSKSVEISFLDGKKNGKETHYLDGEKISQEILWENDKRHGPTKFFIDGVAHADYYYDGNLTSKSKYEELVKRDEMISRISDEVKVDNPRK